MSSEDLRLELTKVIATLSRIMLDETPPRKESLLEAHRGTDTQRAEDFETLRKEFLSMVKDHATTGQWLDRWLQEHPDSMVAQTIAIESKRDAAIDILKRIDGGQNTGEAIEMLALYSGSTVDAIQQSLKRSKRSR